MNYCIVNAENVIENIIVADESFANEIGALPYYEGADVGSVYAPPQPEPEPDPEPELSVWDELDAAYQQGYHEGYVEGVNTAYDQ